MLSKDDYVFFWKPEGEHGWASQWYPSPFTATIEIDGKEETATFATAEHWMMVQKALLFKDWDIARRVLEERNLAEVKALGRLVSGFDDATWVAKRQEIVVAGNMLKFEQHEDLRQLLVDTGSRRLVEASPRDRIWGVGFGAKNALNCVERWGLNLLGLALEEVRGKVESM